MLKNCQKLHNHNNCYLYNGSKIYIVSYIFHLYIYKIIHICKQPSAPNFVLKI